MGLVKVLIFVTVHRSGQPRHWLGPRSLMHETCQAVRVGDSGADLASALTATPMQIAPILQPHL